MRHLLAPLFAPLICLALLGAPAHAAFETRASAAWVYDLTTDTVLLEKNADLPLPPASMSKLMTLYMLFRAIRENPAVSLDTQFTISSRAQAMGGSTMMLQQGDRPTAEDLIKGVVVQSGNDATVAIAEGLAGTEEAFSQLMTERARTLGMQNSVFKNSSGWPAEGHVMSMRDLGNLSTRIITEYPEYYEYFAMTEYHFADRAPANRFNRNPILGLGVGADGLKTGHTSEAGYGLAGSAKQGDRRIVFVISGMPSAEARAEESERIVNWAFRQFVARDLVTAGQIIAEAPVFLGKAETVGLVADRDVTSLVPLTTGAALTGEVRFVGPLKAPVLAGTLVGELIITIPEMAPVIVGLRAQNDVPQGGFVQRLGVAANHLLGQVLGAGAADAAVR